VPPDATKSSHGAQRELFKQCTLGTQYGMEAESLAGRIGQPTIVARELLRAHRQTYRRFWEWSDAALDHAMLHGSLHTVFGWYVHVGESPNPRSLRNFPMQANGAEMLRLACCLAVERGVEIVGPVHDATLICAITRWPARYMDERGSIMWERVMKLIDERNQHQKLIA
jgi:DNA polymerase I